jgi:hypothetical protein
VLVAAADDLGVRTRRGRKGQERRRFAGEDVPVFLLAVIKKGERDNLSKAERNELRKELGGIAEDYRAGQRTRIAELRTGRSR